VLQHFGADHHVANLVPGVKRASGADRDDAARIECARSGDRCCGGNLPHAAAEECDRGSVNRSNEEVTLADSRERVRLKSCCDRFKGGALCAEGGGN
jgi:hypothetical protein